MNKAIFIGELSLNVTLPSSDSSSTAATRVGDRLVKAAMLDGEMGVETIFVGETAADAVGDHIISALERSGIGTGSVDRFTEGASPVRISAAAGDDSRAVIHSAYPSEPVNPIWPRVNEGDVAVYGSYMVVDKRNHSAITELLDHARARKAETVYLPYFDVRQVSRTTRVMPEVWDCLEAASLVIATTGDLAVLFPGEDAETAFRGHILFYCRRCLVLDYASLTMRFFDGDESWTLRCHPTENDEFHWTAGAIAGAVRALTEKVNDPDDIMAKANETAHSILSDR